MASTRFGKPAISHIQGPSSKAGWLCENYFSLKFSGDLKGCIHDFSSEMHRISDVDF